MSILCVFFCLLLAFELPVHTKREFWSPSSMQELSSFHLVDPNSDVVMMIVMNDVWDVKKMFGIIVLWLQGYQIEILNYVFERTWKWIKRPCFWFACFLLICLGSLGHRIAWFPLSTHIYTHTKISSLLYLSPQRIPDFYLIEKNCTKTINRVGKNGTFATVRY